MHLDIRGSETQLTSCKNVLSKKRSREVALHGQTCLKKLRGEEGIKMEEESQSFIQKECLDTDDSNIVSNEAVEQPSEDANSNEDDEEIVISQNDTNLKAATREQVNRSLCGRRCLFRK